MKLTWEKCPCGSKHCKLRYPREIGQFHGGTGFQPFEVTLMDKAFACLEENEQSTKPG